jgi:hypothetical protein
MWGTKRIREFLELIAEQVRFLRLQTVSHAVNPLARAYWEMLHADAIF